MSILGTIFKRKQTCLNCGQTSNPVAGQGDWKVSGKMSGSAVIKCLKCGAGLVMGTVSDSYIKPEDMKKMEAGRDRILGKNKY